MLANLTFRKIVLPVLRFPVSCGRGEIKPEIR